MALDGRIEAGDMILQVNDIAFDNFTNDQAVDVLRYVENISNDQGCSFSEYYDVPQINCYALCGIH